MPLYIITQTSPSSRFHVLSLSNNKILVCLLSRFCHFQKKITNNNIINYPLQKSTWMLNLQQIKFLCIFYNLTKAIITVVCGIKLSSMRFSTPSTFTTLWGERNRKRHLYLYILLVIKINEGKVKDIMFPFPNLFSLNTTSTLNTRYLIISLYLQSMVIAWPIHLSTRQRFWNHHYFGQ